MSNPGKIPSLQKWTGKHTRVVWVQDQGNGSDTFLYGSNFMLYGFDSTDVFGERPLVRAVGNFFKPLFTPDGNNVIVSNRVGKVIYMVEWATGKVTLLGKGIAVAVWQEPDPSFFFRKKRTWVYCYFGGQTGVKELSSQPLYRFSLADPQTRELVMAGGKSDIAWSTVQLSRDGELLGGLSSWPEGGAWWVEEKRWQGFGKGCWTSLSPDNSKLLWIFDGLHRNVHIYDVNSERSWKVNINNAPGIGGYEVYHPRWSNHPRYFVMTGPYEKGEGGNKIGGGGKNVEIYIGRFDESASAVEDYYQVTRNNKGDFYPDLWVEDGENVYLTKIDTGDSKTEKNRGWPTAEDNLIFVWENMKAENQIIGSAPTDFYQCDIKLRGKALYTRNLQVSIAGGWAETEEAGEKIGAALAHSGRLTIEFVLTPGRIKRGVILSFSANGKDQLIIEQVDDSLLVRKLSSGALFSAISWSGVIKDEETQHLLLTFADGKIELFRDGKNLGKKSSSYDFGSTKIDKVVFGSPTQNWDGILESIALYNKALTSSEIEANSRVLQDLSDRQTRLPQLLVTGKLLETTEIPAPEAIGAYRRALVVNTYSVEEVLEGDYSGADRVLVAEWAVLDRQIIKAYKAAPIIEQLALEKFDQHPELEGERQMMDLFEPDLEMYYRLPVWSHN